MKAHCYGHVILVLQHRASFPFPIFSRLFSVYPSARFCPSPFSLFPLSPSLANTKRRVKWTN